MTNFRRFSLLEGNLSHVYLSKLRYIGLFAPFITYFLERCCVVQFFFPPLSSIYRYTTISNLFYLCFPFHTNQSICLVITNHMSDKD